MSVFDLTWTDGKKKVMVPELPRLDLSPKSHKAIVTCAHGHEAQAMHQITRPFLERYARRTGADLVVLDWPGHEDWPMSCKFGVAAVLDHYDRIAYLDADTLVRDKAVNLFDLCAPDEFGACDELPFHRFQPQYGVEKAYLRLRRQLSAYDSTVPFYFNLGVYVCSARHQHLIAPPNRAIPPEHCSEQHLVNSRILDGYLKGHVKVRCLDKRANWQNWTDFPGFATQTDDAILHWSGACEARFDRVTDMRKVADLYPLPEEPETPDFEPEPGPWPHHTWQADLRHVKWLNKTLMSGRFAKVLEVGCYHGWSTSAILAAARAGKVKEVHLCEPKVAPQLRNVIEHYGVPVKLHECGSKALKERDFDLVFLDGDHSPVNSNRERQQFMGTPAIFAHDTSAAGRYAGCEGPQYIKAAFQAAGYLCLEDCLFRLNERTERGMFFAASDPSIYEIGWKAMRETCCS